MKKKIKQNLTEFEVLNESSQGNLVGGFSVVMTASASAMLTETNNCQGGNCKTGCGAEQNVGACNSVPGCGVKL